MTTVIPAIASHAPAHRVNLASLGTLVTMVGQRLNRAKTAASIKVLKAMVMAAKIPSRRSRAPKSRASPVCAKQMLRATMMAV